MDAPHAEVIYVGFNCPTADAPILIRSERDEIEPWGREIREKTEGSSFSDDEIADAMRYFGRDPGDLL